MVVPRVAPFIRIWSQTSAAWSGDTSILCGELLPATYETWGYDTGLPTRSSNHVLEVYIKPTPPSVCFACYKTLPLFRASSYTIHNMASPSVRRHFQAPVLYTHTMDEVIPQADSASAYSSKGSSKLQNDGGNSDRAYRAHAAPREAANCSEAGYS